MFVLSFVTQAFFCATVYEPSPAIVLTPLLINVRVTQPELGQWMCDPVPARC